MAATPTPTPTPTATPTMVGPAGVLEAIYLAINDIQPTYRMRAPQGTARPYFILYPIGGEPAYCFNAVIGQPELQITQYYDWTGDTDTGITDNEAIITALDKKSLTDDGIIIYRLTEPYFLLHPGEDRPVLSIVQRWRFQYLE